MSGRISRARRSSAKTTEKTSSRSLERFDLSEADVPGTEGDVPGTPIALGPKRCRGLRNWSRVAPKPTSSVRRSRGLCSATLARTLARGPDDSESRGSTSSRYEEHVEPRPAHVAS